MNSLVASLTAAVLLALLPLASRADLLEAINDARAAGCERRAGIKAPLQRNPKLDVAARRLYQGATLHDAMRDADYHGVKSTSVRMGGSLGDAAVARVFRNRFCSYLLDADLQHIGSYRKGRELWFVLAQPFPMQTLRDARNIEQRVLSLINAARSRARRCGKDSFAAASPLLMSDALRKAALEHSKDMAKKGYFEHEGSDGSTPAVRVARQHYKWQTVGENLAAGIITAEDAVKGWLGSPHHCSNLMNPRFTETGIAYVVNPNSPLGIYWTQVFAVPRRE